MALLSKPPAAGASTSVLAPVAVLRFIRVGRLKGLRPRIKPLRSRHAPAPLTRQERDQVRDEQPWRRWYKTAAWQKLRMAVLVRDLFTCQRCGRIEGDTSQLVADHKRPHRGVAALFWDILNLWTLCKTCHDSWKQREENRRGW